MQGSGFSLSVYSPNQVLKMGTSVDYGVCKGKRKDGMACTAIINKYVVWTLCSYMYVVEHTVLVTAIGICKFDWLLKKPT